MDYDPAIAVLTPEGIELRQPLAGIGSRIQAQLVDLVVRCLIVGAGLVIALLTDDQIAGPTIFFVFTFIALYCYDVLFEVYADGRTPGKRLVGLRVLEADGRRIGWRASAVRNAMRLVDGPLTAFLGGAISTVATARSQRLGDLAAGTIVAREKLPAEPREYAAPARAGAGADDSWASDTSALRPEELAAVTEFLARREELLPAARRRLAQTLADGLRPRVGGSIREIEPAEEFLVRLVAERRARA